MEIRQSWILKPGQRCKACTKPMPELSEGLQWLQSAQFGSRILYQIPRGGVLVHDRVMGWHREALRFSACNSSGGFGARLRTQVLGVAYYQAVVIRNNCGADSPELRPPSLQNVPVRCGQARGSFSGYFQYGRRSVRPRLWPKMD